MRKQLLTAFTFALGLAANAQFTPMNMASMEWAYQNKMQPYNQYVLNVYSGSSLLPVYTVDITRTGTRITAMVSNSNFTDDLQSTTTVNGNVIVAVNEKRANSSGAPWVNNTRETIYSNGTQDTAFMIETWNTTSNQWDTSGYRSAQWNGTQLTGTRSWYYGATSNGKEFIPSNYNTMFYSSGELLADSSYNWSTSTSSYSLASYKTYFNTGSRIDSVHGSGPVTSGSSTFMVKYRQIMTNNSSGQMTELLQIKWDENNSIWKNDNQQIWQSGTTGIDDMSSAVSFNIYPNPAQNVINMELANSPIDRIEVYNIAGKLAAVVSGITGSIDCSEWANGLYILKAYTNGSVVSHKKVMINR